MGTLMPNSTHVNENISVPSRDGHGAVYCCQEVIFSIGSAHA